MSHSPSESFSDVVFLVGSAHSGKTEIGAALGECAETVVVRHAYFWRDLYGRCGSLSREENLVNCLRRLGDDPLLRSVAIDRDHLAKVAEAADGVYGRLFLMATVEAVRRLGGRSIDPRRLVIQIGGLEGLAASVSQDLPKALFIHTIRDPRQYFGPSEFNSRSGRLGWRLASWSTSAKAAIRNRVEMASRYLVVRGEDLIEKPAWVASEISSHIGVDLNLGEATPSLKGKGGPLSRHRAVIVERLVGQQLEMLGYPLDRPDGTEVRSGSVVDAGMYHLRSRLAVRSAARS